VLFEGFTLSAARLFYVIGFAAIGVFGRAGEEVSARGCC
jgi:hypothetical protein